MTRKKTTVITILSLAVILTQIVIAYFVNKSYLGKENNDENQISGTITFVSNRTDKQKEILELIDDFENVYPKVKVKLELIGDAEEILQRKASVGELPDVTVVPNAISSKEYDKFFLPIDDLGFKKEDIYNYDEGVDDNGVLYNLSTSLSWYGVIYNKKIFDELGIDKIPVTKEEFFKVCDEIKNNGIVPVALNYKQSWIMNTWLDIVPNLYNLNYNNDLLDKSYNILDSESDVFKSVEFLREIYKYGYCEKNLINYEWEECKSDIAHEKIAMIIWNSDFMNQLSDMGMNAEDIGIFPIPETKNVIIDGDYRIGVSKNTKYPKASKAFLKYLFENDRYAHAVNIMSNMKNSDSSKKLLDNICRYDVAIKFQEDIISQRSEIENYNYNTFLKMKNDVGINYNLVQKYIIAPDAQSIRDSINKEWKIEKSKYRSS